MVKLKTIVVDDEPLARKLILSCLDDFQGVEVVAECANGREAVSAVLELEPDLMFLDISMPGLNGFVGEVLILAGAFVVSPAFAAVAATEEEDAK